VSQQNNNGVAQSLFMALKYLYDEGKFVPDKTGVKTVEIVNGSISLDPQFPYLDLGIFKAKEEYIKKELEWYLSQKLNIHPIMDDVKIWNEVCGRNGEINSNYGWAVFSPENWDQFGYVLSCLKKDKWSRRAVMQYNRPVMVVDYNRDGMSDYLCTLSVQVLIRDSKLYYIVTQRSCDFRTGLPNDFAWHAWVYKSLFNLLKEEYPDLEYSEDGIQMNFGSVHLYERNFGLFQKWEEYLQEQSKIEQDKLTNSIAIVPRKKWYPAMYFTKVRDVQSPLRAHDTDAGMDFYVPKFSDDFIRDFEVKNPKIKVIDKINIELKPHERVLIPSGIKAHVPENHMLMTENKSGVASKLGLDVMAKIVDEPYNGEIHLSLANTSNETVLITEGQKLVQLIAVPVSYVVPTEITNEEYQSLPRWQETSRGEGGFGSTGTK